MSTMTPSQQGAARAPAGQAQPSPELLFTTLNAFQRTAALKAAIELGVFTAIGEGAHAAAAIAERTGSAERGARILCDYLAILGFLVKQGDAYELTADSAAFLDRRSPAYLGSIAQFIASPDQVERFAMLAEAVRRGGTAVLDDDALEPDHRIWVEFARSMAPLMKFPAGRIAELLGAARAEPWRVLDIAAGHGLFGITVAVENPNARVVAVDWPSVLALAAANARAAGVGDRYEARPGSAFEVDFGSGYDVVLLTNFLHHFDRPTCERLLRKVHAAMAPGGRVAVLEFVPNPDRVSPPIPAAFSLTMLAVTPAGDAYTFADLQSMLHAAGFSGCELHALVPTPGSVVIARR